MIGSSVTDPGWLDQIPADRPALIVAEGLLMYLTEAQLRDLLQRLTDRFGTGELLADLLSPWGPRFSNSPLLAKASTAGITKWGTRDGHELPEWNPRLHLVETSMFLDAAKIPLKPQRLIYRMVAAVPFMRNYDRLYRFRF
jgi:O-methyltransferase involved in polyketide biosynthesis